MENEKNIKIFFSSSAVFLNFAPNKTKIQKFQIGFSRHVGKKLSNHDCTGFNMIYHLTQSDDYLWYMILRGKQKGKKTKTHPNSKFLPIFYGQSENCYLLQFFSKHSTNFSTVSTTQSATVILQKVSNKNSTN